MIRKLAPYTKGYRIWIILGVLCSAGEAVLELLLPKAMSQIVDVGIANGDKEYILAMGLKMILMALASLVMGVGAAALAARAGMGFGANVRAAEYAQVQRFSFANIEHFSTASLITRLTNDVSSVQMTLMMGMRMLVRAPVMLITAIIKARGAKKVAMFTDKGIEGAGLFALPEEAVKASGAEYYVLDELPPEPSYMAVQKLVDEFKVSGADLIVACGGGSVMDAAKLASVLVTDAYGVKELLDNPGMAQKCVPIVLIPTTAGTGAEVTPNAIVAVPEKELKVGIVNENMIADYVILDARMIKNLPRKIAAATGVDALAHCIECFTSNKANPFSDLYALEGLDLILNNIEKACDDPDAMTEKNRMQIAAYYGGLAITASGTTAVHALSYPLGGKYHIAHGVSNAILLAPVMRFNSEHPAVKERLAVAYDRCCHENKTCTTVDEKAAWMIARLEAIVKHLDIPTSLKEFGVPAEDLEGLVESGMQVQRLLVNNMRPVTADDARKLYQEIM